MSYSTPHHAHEYMKAAALAVVHDYVLACRGKTAATVPAFLLKRREIDFNARLAHLFGPEASIGAQGVSARDLRVGSPLLEVELKYLRRKAKSDQPVNAWKDVIKDWNWLLGLTNTSGCFKRSCWVLVLPSVTHFDFHLNFQVPQARQSNGIVEADYAPFLEIVGPTGSATAGYKLTYKTPPPRADFLLQVQGSKVRVRRQIIGFPTDPIWCMVFSRVGDKEYKVLQHLPGRTFSRP